MKGSTAAAAALLLGASGCASVSAPPRLHAPDTELARTPEEATVEEGGDWDREPPFRLGLRRDSYSVSLWAWRPNDDSGGPAGGNEAGGATFEWSRFEPSEGSGRIPVHGLLVEVLGGRTESRDREEVTHAAEAAVWWTSGGVTGARGDPAGGLRDWRFRSDFLLGFRLVRARERDDDVGTLFDADRDRITAPEFSIGLRLESSPARGFSIFGRVDLGLFFTAASFEWVVGVRVQPIRALALEGGWRGLATAGGGIFDSMTYSWRGPWAGVVVSF